MFCRSLFALLAIVLSVLLWFTDSDYHFKLFLALLTSIFWHFTDIDECASTPCDKNAACANTDGSFICTCKTGYSGDGFACEGRIIW